MLQIKDGKVCGSNYSFVLPQGFNRITGVFCFNDNDLVLVATNTMYLQIVIYFEKGSHSAKNDMQQMFDENKCFIKMSNFAAIKRGKGVGIGVFYENTFGAIQHYEERYDFKMNKDGESQLLIDISLYSGREKNRQTIQEALELPNVKAFLESIEYF